MHHLRHARWEAALDGLPGFEYEHEQITDPFADTAGEHLAHIAMSLPMTTVGRLKPTHPVTWIPRNAVLFVAVCLWLFTIGWILLLAGLAFIPVEESWQSMRDR